MFVLIRSLFSQRAKGSPSIEFKADSSANLPASYWAIDPSASWPSRAALWPPTEVRYSAYEHDDSPAFVFDLMEPERPRVDRAVLDFVQHVFDPTDFVIRGDGVCRLNPEMARMVVALVSIR